MNRQENLFRNLSSPFTRLIRSFQMSRKTTSKTKARPNDNSFRSVTQTPQFRCRRKCMSLFRVEPYEEYRYQCAKSLEVYGCHNGGVMSSSPKLF